VLVGRSYQLLGTSLTRVIAIPASMIKPMPFSVKLEEGSVLG